MSNWEEFKFEERIRKILSDIKYFREDHHFGRPFLTAYQIAIEFKKRYPEDFKKIGLPVGGKGIGNRNSLAQYLAGQLSRRFKELSDIECAFISNKHLKNLSFDNEGFEIISSLTETEFDLSMFRLK